MDTEVIVTEPEIADGLRQLGVGPASVVQVHSSLKSFGHVDGGAATVCRALIGTGATVMMVAGTGDLTTLPAPPGLVRPNNSYFNADTWQDFDEAVAKAEPFGPDLPVDRWLGRIAETMRSDFDHVRGVHPLFSFLAVGPRARELMDAQRMDWPLGPLDVLADLDGHVLLLGVSHTSNTAIHLAEQRLGRGCFYRYGKTAPGVWSELPNYSGESHRFDDIEPHLRPMTTEVMIGRCRARLMKVTDILDVATRLIEEDPAAMLCDTPECRCGGALQQRLAILGRQSSRERS